MYKSSKVDTLEVIRLHDQEDLDFREIGYKLGISQSLAQHHYNHKYKFCPVCQSPEVTVVNSRPLLHKFFRVGGIKRRKKCEACEFIFNTWELDAAILEAMIEKIKALETIQKAFDNVT